MKQSDNINHERNLELLLQEKSFLDGVKFYMNECGKTKEEAVAAQYEEWFNENNFVFNENEFWALINNNKLACLGKI